MPSPAKAGKEEYTKGIFFSQVEDTPMLKDWHTDDERLALTTHRTLTYLGGYEDGS